MLWRSRGLQFCQEEVLTFSIKVPSTRFISSSFQVQAKNNFKHNKTTTKKPSQNAFVLSDLVLWRVCLDPSVPSWSPQSREDTGAWGVCSAPGLRDGEGPRHRAHEGRLRELPLVVRVGGTGVGCPEKLWMPHPCKCSRPGGMRLSTTWSSERCPCP